MGRALRLGSLLALALALPSCNRNDLSSGPTPVVINSEPPPPQVDPCAAPDLRTFPVVINEVMVKNGGTIADEDGDFGPWIELYNPTDKELTLTSVGLSDDLSAPEKWKFVCDPKGPPMIEPHGFVVVFADGKDRTSGHYHTNFTLADGKLSLALNRGSSTFAFNTHRLKSGQSAGLFPDGEGDIITLEKATPGGPNQETGDPLPGDQGKFIRGDADGNGHLTVSDMSLVLKVVNGQASPPPCQDRLDANDDGKIDLQDVAFLRDVLFGTLQIPPPFPDAGVDPTPDDLPCPEAP